MAGFATADLRKPILKIFAEAQKIGKQRVREEDGFRKFNPEKKTAESREHRARNLERVRKQEAARKRRQRQLRNANKQSQNKSCEICKKKMRKFNVNGAERKYCGDTCKRKARYI